MPALAERTKIKTGSAHIPMTTSTVFWGGGHPESFKHGINEPAIDSNLNLIASGSTRIDTFQYLPELSPKAKELLLKIYRFKELPNNWDENGAMPPNDDIINMASFFLRIADEYDLPLYFTAPGPNGEIVLEFKSKDRSAEVYFEEDRSEMILYVGNNQSHIGEVSLAQLTDHFRVIHGKYHKYDYRNSK